MTWAELAAACIKLGRRTDRRGIIAYKEAGYYPRLPTFAALARVLGVSMDVLWYGGGGRVAVIMLLAWRW